MPFELAPHDRCGFCRYLADELACAFVAEDALAAAFVNQRQYELGAVLVRGHARPSWPASTGSPSAWPMQRKSPWAPVP